MSGVFVRTLVLPDAVCAVTLPNDDGTFSVFINETLDEAHQRDALEHELRHIRRDHFYNADTVVRNESQARGAT